MRHLSRSQQVDRLVAALGAEQKNVVSHEQLVSAGVHPRTIGRRIETCRLHPLFQGVYAVGRPDVGREGWWMAAVLAAGEGAILSTRSAGAAWDLSTWHGAEEVTSDRKLRPRPGLLLHHVSLPHDEVTELGGIPITTPARTLLDLAGVLLPDRLDEAVNRAEMLGLGSSPGPRELVSRYRGRRGVARLRLALDRLDPDMSHTRRELEARFRRFIQGSLLPHPTLNDPIHVAGRTFVLDAFWRSQRLAVELDGWQSHGTKQAFRRDRARDRTLLAAGIRTARVTWRDLSEPGALETQLAAMLGRRDHGA